MVTCGGGGGGGLTQPYMLHWMMDMHGEKKIEKYEYMTWLPKFVKKGKEFVRCLQRGGEGWRLAAPPIFVFFFSFFPFFLFFLFPVGAASCDSDSDSGRFTCALLILFIRGRSHHQAFFPVRGYRGAYLGKGVHVS